MLRYRTNMSNTMLSRNLLKQYLELIYHITLKIKIPTVITQQRDCHCNHDKLIYINTPFFYHFFFFNSTHSGIGNLTTPTTTLLLKA